MKIKALKSFIGLFVVMSLIFPSVTLASTLYSDDFNRTNSGSVGGTWYEVDNDSVMSISSNKLRINSASDSNARIYDDLSEVSSDIKLTGTITVTTRNSGNNITISVLSNASSYAQGFGFVFQPRASGGAVMAMDGGAFSDSTAFTWNVDIYNFEIIIDSDYARELRVWSTSGSRPSTATLSMSAETPTSNGTYYQIAVDTGGTATLDVSIDNFLVEDLTVEPDPEPTATSTMGMIFSGTQFIVWVLFMLQFAGFLIVMWIIVRLIHWPVMKFVGAIKRLFDVKI